MVWRTPYETVALTQILVPFTPGTNLDGEEFSFSNEGLILGAFSLADQRDLGVWSRLVDQEFPDLSYNTLFIRSEWSVRERSNLAVSVPISRRANTVAITDVESRWQTILKPNRAFAGIIRAGIMPLVMMGPPTEEAWDTFCACVGQTLVG